MPFDKIKALEEITGVLAIIPAIAFLLSFAGVPSSIFGFMGNITIASIFAFILLIVKGTKKRVIDVATLALMFSFCWLVMDIAFINWSPELVVMGEWVDFLLEEIIPAMAGIFLILEAFDVVSVEWKF